MLIIFKKVMFHLRRGTLLDALIRVFHFRGKRSYDRPIGSDYNSEKASIYDAHRENDPYWRAETDSMVGFLSSIPNVESVLDAPFGTGRFLPLYAHRRLKVVALDVSRDMLNQAKKKYPELMGDVSILEQDMSNIQLSDNSIDLVVCYRFLPWIVSYSEAEKSLKELSRVCKQYSILEFCVGKHQTGEMSIRPEKTLWNRMNESELKIWLKKLSFDVMETVELYDDAEHPGLTAFLCRKIV